MSVRMCFNGKIAAGLVSDRAGAQVNDMLDQFEREHQARLGEGAGARQAALEAERIMRAEAAARRDEINGSIIAQSNVLHRVGGTESVIGELRATPGALGFGSQAPPPMRKATQSTLGFATRGMLARDPWEIGLRWNNVVALAQTLRGEAHRVFADAIEFLRPKTFGFRPERTRELDVLRALYGDTSVDPQAIAAANAWRQVAERMADDFIGAGGRLAKRKDWRLPNPEIDETKVRAMGPERFKALVREHIDRDAMLDWATGERMNDARFEQLLDEATQGFLSGFAEGPPTGAFQGRRMLANARDFPRFFIWQSAEGWQAIADAVGVHASPFEAMTGHMTSMTRDTALMRVMGPNPEATKRFIHGLFDREAARLSLEAADPTPAAMAAATKANKKIVAHVEWERNKFDNLWAEVTGANRVPVNTTLAQQASDVRYWLSATQLGSAILSSLTDPGFAMMAARFNGLSVTRTLGRAVDMMRQSGSEVFAAQQGMVLDSVIHAAGTVDRVLGEDIRAGVAMKLASANIRISGLRRWTGILRAAYGLETMATVARVRDVEFAALEPRFRASLERYGIGLEDWNLIRSATPHEPRPNAPFLRPVDVAQGGTTAHQTASEKLSRLVNTEMDYAVIESDPVGRAVLIGQTRPGTAGGEFWRSVAQYRAFPTSVVTFHMARAVARGWNGERMTHAALVFTTMTVLGALAMQAKEIANGRDPLSLNPADPNGLRAWAKATLQGGGLGIFGDVLFIDQTKYGNTWASTIAGPAAGAMEAVLGDFVVKNVQAAAKGDKTHFLGDALYAAGRFVPGSSLWFARLAWQREVLDQLALMSDDRTRERFRRMEDKARKDFGQRYWWRPGRTAPERGPEIEAVAGR